MQVPAELPQQSHRDTHIKYSQTRTTQDQAHVRKHMCADTRVLQKRESSREPKNRRPDSRCHVRTRCHCGAEPYRPKRWQGGRFQEKCYLQVASLPFKM